MNRLLLALSLLVWPVMAGDRSPFIPKMTDGASVMIQCKTIIGDSVYNSECPVMYYSSFLDILSCFDSKTDKYIKCPNVLIEYTPPKYHKPTIAGDYLGGMETLADESSKNAMKHKSLTTRWFYVLATDQKKVDVWIENCASRRNDCESGYPRRFPIELGLRSDGIVVWR